MSGLHDIPIWGGAEYTVNRVQNTFYDQTIMSGHEFRSDDLELIAELGIRCLRFPVIWERVAPSGLSTADWCWTDARLSKLRKLGITPILGLLHHGSGPANTSLLDPDFPRSFSSFARAVAERYPWAEFYTPINEPLTTARFSALYGHWYPHARDPVSFLRAFFTQIEATVLAMREIREVQPDSKLIQTEDFGCVLSTQVLAYQAEFENARRWLTWDSLCGTLMENEAVVHYLRYLGFEPGEMWFLREEPCIPAVLGINHYVTSDRFLDHRLEVFPNIVPGGNGRHRYVDVEAVRICDPLPAPSSLLLEVWNRYRIPLAVTEVHLGSCDEGEQLRWFERMYGAAKAARDSGAAVQAVTSWALFGSYDWNNLVTSPAGHYERGAFDVSEGEPRLTLVGQMVKSRNLENGYHHSALEAHGWWEHPARLLYRLDPDEVLLKAA